jgi:hypothetical protein
MEDCIPEQMFSMSRSYTCFGRSPAKPEYKVVQALALGSRHVDGFVTSRGREKGMALKAQEGAEGE